MLCTAIGGSWLVEQPSQSMLFEHVRLKEMVENWLRTINATKLRMAQCYNCATLDQS